MLNYTSVKFALEAEINHILVDVVSFSASYEMNKIPNCTLTLPVGFSAVLPTVISNAHAAAEQLQLQVPLKVWVTCSPMEGDMDFPTPNGRYLLFCGWATGVGYRRTYEGYSMTVEGTHWLSALSNSSTMSASSHPSNPCHFTFPTAMLNPAGNTRHIFMATKAQATITKENIVSNMWTDAIKAWFLSLAAEDRITITQFMAKGGNAGNDNVAGECVKALNRIHGVLKFNVAGQLSDGDPAAQAIASDIACAVATPSAASNAINSMAQTTFWDKLVGDLAPKYMFSLIPHASYAQVVPFIPGLSNWWNSGPNNYTINAKDIESQEVSAFLPRPIRAVGLFSGYGSRAGCDGGVPSDDGVGAVIGGMYVSNAKAGMVIMREAPRFLTNSIQASVFTGDATGLVGPRGNAFNHPGVGAAPGNPNPELVKQNARTLMDDLAHALYINEVLRNRWGSISGPIRFDIAPGSTIKIQGCSGAFLAPAEERYASVVGVTYNFDAMSLRCGTSYRLAHIKTLAEAQNADFTIQAHPFYTNTWSGAVHLDQQPCPDIAV